MKKLLTCTVLMFTLFLNSGIGEAREFPYVEINNALKPWTVTFSQNVDRNSVTDESVYVECVDTGLKIRVFHFFDTVTNDLRVSPKEVYKEDCTYMLVIKGEVKSESGEQLSEESTLTFKYVPYKDEN